MARIGGRVMGGPEPDPKQLSRENAALRGQLSNAAVARREKFSDEYVAHLRARVAKLEAELRNVRDNYDCDQDAHRHDTPCRACAARAALEDR